MLVEKSVLIIAKEYGFTGILFAITLFLIYAFIKRELKIINDKYTQLSLNIESYNKVCINCSEKKIVENLSLEKNLTKLSEAKKQLRQDITNFRDDHKKHFADIQANEKSITKLDTQVYALIEVINQNLKLNVQ